MAPSQPKISLFFNPAEKQEINIVVMGSGHGTNLEMLLKAQKNSSTPSFRIRAVFANRQCRMLEIGKSEKIPVLYHSFVKFCQKNKENHPDHETTRHQYDQEVYEMIEECSHQHGFNVDMILLAGYMRLVTRTLLQKYPNKFLNIHPADLTVLNSNGTRSYIGLNTVYQALSAGEPSTRSSILLVNETVDGGPLLVSGPKVKYEGEYPITEELAHIHQEKQKIQSDGPACLKALTLISQGKMGLDEQGHVYVDGIKQSASGYDMDLQTSRII